MTWTSSTSSRTEHCTTRPSGNWTLPPRSLLAAQIFRLPLFGQPGSLLEAEARKRRVPFVPEGFPDRRYRADGSLVPRSEPDAVLHDPAEIEAQVLRLVSEGKVATLCIHGDDPRAVANAELVRMVLKKHGIMVRRFRDDLA